VPDGQSSKIAIEVEVLGLAGEREDPHRPLVATAQQTIYDRFDGRLPCRGRPGKKWPILVAAEEGIAEGTRKLDGVADGKQGNEPAGLLSMDHPDVELDVLRHRLARRGVASGHTAGQSNVDVLPGKEWQGQ
jgi:hypothetical protein